MRAATNTEVGWKKHWLLQENDVLFWLADLREMTAILRADETWANENWFPRLFATGLRRMAIVESDDFFNQTSVARSFTAVNGKLTFEVAWFRTLEEARGWLGQGTGAERLKHSRAPRCAPRRATNSRPRYLYRWLFQCLPSPVRR